MTQASGWPGLRLAIYYATFFMIVGIAMPYWPVWLESRGLGPVEIGIVVSVGRWVTILTTPMIARRADRSGERKRLLFGLSAAVTVSYLLFLWTEGFWQILAVAVPAAVFFGAVMPVSDSLTMLHASAGRVDYGRVRLWGSVSFIAASFIGGWLLEHGTEDVILSALIVFAAATTVVSLILPDTRTQRMPPQRRAMRRLLRHPVIAPFLLATALLSGSHAVLYAFGTLHWRQVGISDATIGLLWALGVVAEIALFAVGGRVVARIGPTRLLLLAAAGGVVRWPLLAWSTDPTVLFFAQGLHALTFGALHLGAVHFIARAAPEGLSATVQSLYNALAMSAAIAIVMPLSGPAFEQFGGAAYYGMAGLSLAGGLVGYGLLKRWDGSRIELTATRPATSAS